MCDEQPILNECGMPSFRIYSNDGLGEYGGKLYLDVKTADVHFTFDDDPAKVGAHRNILGVRSDVFKTMFYGALPEKTANICEPGVTSVAFMEFLQYFYLDPVKLTPDHIQMVLALADKYNVQKCVDHCVEFLIKFLSNRNVCSVLRVAIYSGPLELMKACEMHVLLNTAAVFKSTDFLACDRRVLGHLLKMKQFSCSEIDVFEAVMSWVQAKSEPGAVLSKELVDTHLGELLYEIRFATMKIEQFCALAQKYDTILSSHHRTITDMITLSEKTGKFNTRPRHVEWNSDAIVKCEWLPFLDFTKDYDVMTFEKLKFSANVPFQVCSTTFHHL